MSSSRRGTGGAGPEIARQSLAAQEAIPPAYRAGAYLPLIHAEALDATGDHAGTHTAIARALTDLLARAEKIGTPAYRKPFLENVPENARTLTLARQWKTAGRAG